MRNCLQAPLKAEAPLLLEIFHGIFQVLDVRDLLGVEAALDFSSPALPVPHHRRAGHCIPAVTVSWPISCLTIRIP